MPLSFKHPIKNAPTSARRDTAAKAKAVTRTPMKALLQTALETKYLPLTILAILSAISIVSRVILLLR